MTNPDNVGGLPVSLNPIGYVDLASWQTDWNAGESFFTDYQDEDTQPIYTQAQMERAIELCRAAPAGGDVTGLHPATADLVARFATALAAKLAAAERKYGYSDGWASPDWMDECRDKLMEHIAKGDPRDVAAYCAFLWHHGESTAATVSAPAGSGEVEELIDDLIQAASGRYDSGVSRVERQRAETEVTTIRAALLRKLQQGVDYVMVPRSLAVSGAEVCAEWLDLFAETPGLDKYERYTYAPCVEITRDQFRAASQGQEGGK